MSTLYLSSDPRSLADKLADELDRSAKDGDFFAPATIVVPNRFLRKWLRLWLARRLDVAINLDFQPLEDALWHLLRQTDPSSRSSPPEAIEENLYRLMVLSVLLEEDEPSLRPLQGYLQQEGSSLSRLSCRRAWYLADRLGSHLQTYEYHRQDSLIQHWLANQYGLSGAGASHQLMERAQQAVFLHITREPAGKRALLNLREEKTYKTFPQYAMERMTQADPPLSATGKPRTIHFFGFTLLAELHARTVAWLGQFFDIRFYHLNVLASRYQGSLLETAQALSNPNEAQSLDRGRELLQQWGRAGLEALSVIAPLEAHGAFAVEPLTAHEPARSTARKRAPRAASVLSRLRDHLLGVRPAKTRLIQDTSLQIIGCPGIAREVETVYSSILANLQADRSLRQTDIAVLVTDMPKHRAALQAAFERPPQRLQYNMVDFSAAGTSMLGQALLGMLDLAQESFSRTRVFQVILNPCFLARLGVDRVQAMTWLEWAENLGIYQGWDAEEKQQQGYARSPFYAWRIGLQRLRLGRFMQIADDDQPAARFGNVIPFADLASTDREHLDAFCRAVEGLLPTLARLRSAHQTGARWSALLQRLVHEFLDVPIDRPEEAQARAELLSAMEKLSSWDSLHDPSRKRTGLPLALVREYMQSQLELLQGNHGEYLIGGVTISALQPMRPVPFPIIYILGLGEDLFPGSNALSSFDLRAAERRPGDVRPAEARLYDFLATVLAAQQKLYLLFNSHDLQKDQPLQPAVPLQQLQRFLNQNVLSGSFEAVAMPMNSDDARYLDPAQQPAYQDVLIQARDADRCLTLLAARRDNRVTLAPAQEAEWTSKMSAFQRNFAIPQDATASLSARSNVTLGELKRFLHLPAQESLRRHLRVGEDDDRKLEEEEPLVTTQQAAGTLIRQTIQHLVLAAARGDVKQALATWQQSFANHYSDSRLRSLVPEEAFGEIDQTALLADLQERIHGQGQIETFLRAHVDRTFCGPVLLGESLTPLGAILRFPALRLRPGHELPANAPQETRLVGWTNLAWQSPGRFEILVVTNIKEIDGREISQPLIEPMLFYLAMLAGDEMNADGASSQRWLDQREFHLHIAHHSGIQTWHYPPCSITPAEALHYLIELTRDYLDPTQFDLLPFDVMHAKKDLQVAMHEDAVAPFAAEYFRTALEDAIEATRENAYTFVKIPLLVEMIHAQVPTDALAKVQRRFRLLDRGPASVRRQPKLAKKK